MVTVWLTTPQWGYLNQGVGILDLVTKNSKQLFNYKNLFICDLLSLNNEIYVKKKIKLKDSPPNPILKTKLVNTIIIIIYFFSYKDLFICASTGLKN